MENLEVHGSEGLDTKSYIEFQLGSNSYAIPLLLVKEVITLPELTPIPKSPYYYKGLMNLRGHVITVLDLKAKLGSENLQEATQINNDDMVVMVIEKEDVKVGVIIDQVNRVLKLTDGDIASSEDIQDKVNTNYLTGIYLQEGKQTTFIDLFQALDLGEINN
jgi:purine-binding chemotaxis protein CheW